MSSILLLVALSLSTTELYYGAADAETSDTAQANQDAVPHDEAATAETDEDGEVVEEAIEEDAQPPVKAPPLHEHPTLVDLWRQTNRLRAQHKLPPLSINPQLVDAAQEQAWYMADTDDFSHEGNDGLSARVARAGYEGPVSENIARGERNVAQALGLEGSGGWLRSEANRANLLSRELNEVGFGYAISEDQRAYWVAVFGTSTTAPAQAIAAPQEPPPAPVRLMSEKKEARLRSMLPKVSDPTIQAILDDPRLVIYTDDEMPKAYQFWDGMLQGVHRAEYNISANGSEPFGNGNREFPWSTPAGTHRADGVRTFRFLWLPHDDHGHPYPVTWYRKRLSGDGRMGYAWTFPVGTVCGEVLTLAGKQGDYTFELRVRKREVGDWGVDVFRPFPTAVELAARIRELRPDWEEQENLVKFCSHLETPSELPSMTLEDRQPLGRTFEQTMGVDTLPALGDDELVAELLSTSTFHSALGATWRFGSNGNRTAAPTTLANFHVVPAKYDAGFIDVDRVSCVRCHETVNQSVSRFDRSRDWYGRIRGSDGIFSFHPFSPGSISGNGYSSSVHMRDDLVRGGLLEKYDPTRHTADRYSTIDYLTE